MKRKLTKLTLMLGVIIAAGVHLNAQNLALDWASQIGGDKGYILTSSITLDKSNNVFAVGAFTGNIEANTNNGPVKLTAKGNGGVSMDMFIAKIDPTGALDWIKQIGSNNPMGYTGEMDLTMNHLFSITSDEVGNLYITGNFMDTVDFDPGPGQQLLSTHFTQGGSFPGMPPAIIFIKNTFILKLNNDGEFVWVKTIYGITENSSSGIAYDANEGTLGITGYFKGTADFNDKKGVDTLKATNTQDIFVAKYDTSGNFIWTKQMGGSPVVSRTHNALDIHIDQNSYVYTTGMFADSADFDPDPSVINRLVSTSKSGYNVFISKLDKDGKYVWAKGMGDVNSSTTTGTRCKGFAITTDKWGNVYTTGYVAGSVVSLGTKNNQMNVVYPISNLTAFISKVDSNGDYVWGKIFDRITRASQEVGLSIQTDAEGAVYTGGYFFGQTYFDTDATNPLREVFRSTGSTEPFIVKWDTDGDFAWARQVRVEGGVSRGVNLQVAPNKDVYFGGYFDGKADFNSPRAPYTLTSIDQQDGFVMKLICSDTSRLELNLEICGNEYEYLGNIYEESGLYVNKVPNAWGCDSTIYLNLSLFPIQEPVINVEGFKLGVASSYETYQWLLDGEEIQGATDSTYFVLLNGDYQVAVTTRDGCSDTSEVYTVDNAVGVKDMQALANTIRIYPNPSSDIIHIVSPIALDAQVVSLEGKTLLYEKNVMSLSLSHVSAGIYFVNLFDGDGNLVKVEKLVKK